MVALTSERPKTVERDGKTRHTPVAAGVKLFAGAMAAVNAAGFAVPVTAAAGLKGLGRVEETVDNSAGADGEQMVRTTRGVFAVANSSGADELTRAATGSPVYGVDDQTVAKTDGGGTRSAIATLFDVDAAGVWVEF
ncbi:MAG TPA: hypothetical protein VD978_33650 [Azospirillum sp.]|nr:hypothetical protein [Azospirillum sp.]